MWISRFNSGHVHAINHSSAACHRSIAQTRQNYSICVKVFVIVSPTGGVGMGPAGACPGAQGAHHWSSPAPDQQWLGTAAPAAILVRRCDCRPGADTTLSWSRDGGITGKEINVSPGYQKAYFHSTGRGNGATGVHQRVL